MIYSEIRRLLLKLFIAFLSVTAVVAIVSLLSSEFSRTEFKVLATTFSISATSVCAMSCAAFIERGGSKKVGMAGILAATVVVGLVTVGVWGEVNDADYWKSTVTCIVVSTAFAHGCLLHLPKLAADHQWTQTASAILITVLGLQTILAVWGKFKDSGYYQLMAAVSVLVVLATLVVPIFGRLDAKPADEGLENQRQVVEDASHLPDRLVLRRVSGAVFSGHDGRWYRLTEIKAEPGASPNGGPAERVGNSGVGGGPPSVS